MKYKIRDLQFDIRYFGGDSGIIFKTKAEIVNALADYHDIDFTGCDNKDNELDIRDYFKFWKINTIQKQLDFLLDYGEWKLERIK